MSQAEPKHWWEAMFVAPTVAAALVAAIFIFAHNFQKYWLDLRLAQQKAKIDQLVKDEYEASKILTSTISALLTTIGLEIDGMIEKSGEERSENIQRAWAPLAAVLDSKGLSLNRKVREEAQAILSNAVTYGVNAKFPALANPAIFSPPESIDMLNKRFESLQELILRSLRP